MKTFKNISFITRNYETTQITHCVANEAPDENYVECSNDEIAGKDKLWLDGAGNIFYGYL
jgi:hypothetical protein|nr:MAG TPA: hypothetical protein [Caudoviricetes sp.]